jgi:uncharacterized protein
VLRFTELRFDASSIKDLPDGSIKVTGQLANAGVLTYYRGGQAIREYRSPTETFRKDSLATFAGAPITLNHPYADGGKVTASSWKRLAVGHLGDDVRQDGDNVVADMYIRDAAAVAGVKRGDYKHLSMGYHVEAAATPGVTATGEHYDVVQKNMRGNHVALLPRGTIPRGGDACVLRLDAAGDEVREDMAINQTMANELEVLTAQNVALKGENEKLRTDAAEVPALRASVADLTGKLAAATAEVSAERLDALVEERVAAMKMATDNKIDPKGKSSLQIKRAVVAARTPDLALRVDSYGVETLDAVIATYAAAPHPTMAVLGDAAGTAGTVQAPVVPVVPGTRTDAIPSISDLRAKAQAAESKMWQAGSDMPRSN